MHYTDLATHTAALAAGRHTIYDLPEGRVEIRNLGVRHPMLPQHPEYRLCVTVDSRVITPRHGDFFVDYLLKVDARPELRLPLTEACEQVCNGLSPREVMQNKKLPRWFGQVGEETAALQKTLEQTGGLPTEVFLCGLQCLIRVYELNQSLLKPPEAFRQAFLKLEKGQPYVEVARELQPQVMPGKRYFNRLTR